MGSCSTPLRRRTERRLYVSSTTDDGEYAVFLTNRNEAAPADVRGLCNRYGRRWVIENEYEQVKQFLPTMALTDYRVRAFNFVFSCLPYNVWRLVDHLLTLEVDGPVGDQPMVTAGETIELLACFLVPTGRPNQQLESLPEEWQRYGIRRISIR